MARIQLNPMILSLSGKIGGRIYRHNADGSTSLCKLPSHDPNRVLSERELQTRKRFTRASAYCQVLKQDPEKLAAYQFVTQRRGPMARVYTTIMADILKPPSIDQLDLNNYQGHAGNTISLHARETVAIARLTLSLHDETAGQEIETAEKIYVVDDLAPSAFWPCTTTVSVPGGHTVRVTATAYDLAGNKAELAQTKTL